MVKFSKVSMILVLQFYLIFHFDFKFQSGEKIHEAQGMVAGFAKGIEPKCYWKQS